MDDLESPSGERQPRRKRGLRWLVRGSLGLVVLLALAVAFRDAWIAPLVVRWARETARERLGAELEIGGVSSHGLTSWTLEDVRWRSNRPPLLRVDQARVELSFSLGGAWEGRPRPAIRLEGRGIEIQPDAQGEVGGEPLPDLERVELALEDVRLRRASAEPLHFERFAARGALEAMRARVEELEVVLAAETGRGQDRAVLRDAELDLGAGNGLDLLRSARGRLEATLPDGRALAQRFDPRLPLERLELVLGLDAGRASLTGRVEIEGGSLVIERGALALPGNGDFSQLELSLGMSAEIRDLAPLEPLLGRPLTGRWQGSVDVDGPLQGLVGRFVGHGEGLSVGGLELGEFEIDVRTDGKRARLEHCEMSGPELVAVLRGDLELAPLRLVDVALNVSADRGALASIVPVPCEHVFVHARLDGPPSAPSGAFELSAEKVVLESFTLEDAAARGRIEGEVLHVDEARLTSNESFVELSGELRPEGSGWSAALDALTLAWQGARVALRRPGRVTFGPGRVSIDGLELASEKDGSQGSATIALQHDGGETRASLDFAQYDAGPLLAPFLPPGLAAGRVDGHVEGRLGGAEGDEPPSLALALELADWRVGAAWPALTSSLRGRYDGKDLALERFELGFNEDEGLAIRGSLRLPVDLERPFELAPGPMGLDLEVATQDAVRGLRRAGIEPGLSSTGPCRLSLDLAGESGRLQGTLALDAFDVTMGTEARARACDLTAEIGFGNEIEVRRAVFSAPSGTITLDGRIATALDLARWREDPATLVEAPLALSAKVDLADIGWIAGLSGELRRISGQVAGRVGIAGDVRQPELSGGLEWTQGEMRLVSNATPLRAISARLGFDRYVVRIEDLSGEVGGAPVSVSGTLEPFGPFPRLDLRLKGESVLLARNERLRLRADADLRVKGNPAQLAIQGDLAVAEALYFGEISPLEELMRLGKRSQPEAPARFTLAEDGILADASFNVHLAGRRTFEYQTNLLEASLRPDAWLRGTGAFPVIEGQAYVEEAKLTLPSGDLKLSSGVLTFRPEAPLQPEVALKANLRVQRHDVQAVMTGTLGEDMEVVLSSSPPMASDDLWILVLTGQLPTSRWQDRSTQAMEALAVFLARDSLVRWFSSDQDTTESLLDRFEIDVGAKTSQSGQPTGRVLFYLRPQTRRSQRATYLSAEIDEYDRANYAIGIVFRPR